MKYLDYDVEYNHDLTDRENFEALFEKSDEATKRFSTWDEAEQLYTDPQLCFQFQLQCIGFKLARCLKMCEGKIKENQSKKDSKDV